MSKREIIGVYPGDVANPEDIAEDMKNYVAQEELKKAEAEGFTYVGTIDKDTTDAEKKAIFAKAVEMHEKHFFGEE